MKITFEPETYKGNPVPVFVPLDKTTEEKVMDISTKVLYAEIITSIFIAIAKLWKSGR